MLNPPAFPSNFMPKAAPPAEGATAIPDKLHFNFFVPHETVCQSEKVRCGDDAQRRDAVASEGAAGRELQPRLLSRARAPQLRSKPMHQPGLGPGRLPQSGAASASALQQAAPPRTGLDGATSCSQPRAALPVSPAHPCPCACAFRSA